MKLAGCCSLSKYEVPVVLGPTSSYAASRLWYGRNTKRPCSSTTKQPRMKHSHHCARLMRARALQLNRAALSSALLQGAELASCELAGSEPALVLSPAVNTCSPP